MNKQEIMNLKPAKGNKFIYRYYDKDGSYIGQTKRTLKERAGKNGKNYLTNENKWSNAIQQKGFDNFKVEILCECLEKEADNREKEFIKKFNSRKNGYNSTYGGVCYNPYQEYSRDKKYYIWNIDENNLSEDAKKINQILCKELKVKSAKDFDKIKFVYSYYAYEEEYCNFYVNLGLLIDNFEIYKNAEEILLSYFQKDKEEKDYISNLEKLINYYHNNEADFEILDTGEVVLTREQSKQFGGVEIFWPQELCIYKKQSLFDFLINDYCPQNEILGGDLITSGDWNW